MYTQKWNEMLNKSFKVDSDLCEHDIREAFTIFDNVSQAFSFFSYLRNRYGQGVRPLNISIIFRFFSDFNKSLILECWIIENNTEILNIQFWPFFSVWVVVYC